MDLLVKGAGFREGYVVISGPEHGVLKMLEFGRLGLVQCRPYEGDTGGREAVFDIISGTARLEVTDGPAYERLGGRTNPFTAGPTLICLPPGTRYRFTAVSATVDMAVSYAPAEPGLPVSVIGPNDIPVNTAGAGNWSRTIRPGTSVGAATQRLMMAETLVPPGNWTSYPPHKHDVDTANESVYEEVYFYLFKPADGYGFQRVYDAPGTPGRIDVAYTVEDGDAVAIPHGYHPLVAAAGYQLVYIWAMVGKQRIYGAWSDDPAHSWIRGAEAIMNA